MALKEKQFKIYDKPDQPEFIVNFIPEVVDDLEVYSVVNSKKQHCGYVTPELLDFFTYTSRKRWRRSWILLE